jgi:D-tagatose-1,6-bisphosphate aldolase subunit GatZ/KbaZ
LILGGDHLGPLTWMNENSTEAMTKSIELIREYVLAGFTKIHIDTSMKLGDDDKNSRLDTETIAERGAILCREAEKAYEELLKRSPGSIQPVYIVGSEVPIPGGSQEEDEVNVTKVEDFRNTVESFKRAFLKHDLKKAWENVIGVVVQPGVEFGDIEVHDYNRGAALELTNELKKYPNIVFEGHSTDYQSADALREMVEDGIAILKVGPALTFALREGLFGLNYIENELFKYNPEIEISNFINVLDTVMAKSPSSWKNHYHGNSNNIRFARKFSMSDRCRYYLPVIEVQQAMKLMIDNLKTREIPLTLIGQFMPIQYKRIRSGIIKNDPEVLLKDVINNYIDDYIYATKPGKVTM